MWTIARHLGVAPAQLREATQALQLPASKRVHYKLKTNVQPESVAIARLLAEQVAKFVALGTPDPMIRPYPTAEAVRAAILEKGAPWVSFTQLVDYCWSLGVPVVHLSTLPTGAKKMEGMAVSVGDRPAIVLTGKKGPAWMLFVLAHELGHICSGHVDDNSSVIDGDIDEGSNDPQEKQANAFALAVITGSPTMRVLPRERWLPAPQLAAAAHALGAKKSIDPGHIVLNYAHSMGHTFWGVANSALKQLPSEGDALAILRENLSAKLDWSNLPKEAAEFVARMAELGTASPQP
ncbi:MAG: ImmA/IrrE family metallo-endopeptidase [Planctomycetes bacterium]|nr:ImmA/IrrE family metallo-endopeptidase [Planctomycetota bacterium]